ncbi:ferrous iron transport protein B [Marinilabilia rubra]|uniref:Ferrous iron transport protein B n=1 Tax=Marinilabilia rubra TaxID=2162893 RepID=A0A2U2B3R8_9BACT|nr:ferrous iron transport protein B [Marinilabilia rubra]PWD97706.1 ferrous iron transport protein B [Marinilabilia rubra]
MNLAELTNGQEGVIVKVKGHGAFRKRIIEMGFVKGKRVTVIKNAPLKDPIEYKVMDYKVSLRRSEASLIEVVSSEEAKSLETANYQGTTNDDILTRQATERRKTINVALVGNPNCGKTTIFNQASGANEHVGNYSGVTIDIKTGYFYHKDYTLKVSDLPGTYSLSAYSPEEVYVREHISYETPDIIINVVDASNLERNLYLTSQLIDMDVRTVVALNMYDDLQKKGDKIDHHNMGTLLGIPFVPTVGYRGKGISELFEMVVNVYEDKIEKARRVKINYGEHIEMAIAAIENTTKDFPELTSKVSPRFLAIKLLEKDNVFQEQLSDARFEPILKETGEQIHKLEKNFQEDSETVITDSRYGFIAGAMKETYKENPRQRRRKTEIIDTVLTHRLFGFPFFFLFIWIMFQATFKLGEYPMNWIEEGVSYLSGLASSTLPPGPFTDLIVDGILGGVGGVIVFLPNILILFFFISFMEDTGYMARAAFIMDKVMHKIGLHGKSFIPLIMGFGCNVPAIMSTRTIEDKNNRLLTMLINPFMSCSARLPVYILLIGAFFPDHPGTVLFALYAIGILLAVIVARIFKRFVFKKSDTPFVMELPPYRLPTLKSTSRHMWFKGSQYLKKMGGVIMVASIIIWFLGYYPRQNEATKAIEAQKQELVQKYDEIKDVADGELQEKLEEEQSEKLSQLKHLKEKLRHEGSYIGQIGKAIEPAIEPLGFDWKMGVSLLSGVAAKEIVVSTMAVLYQADDSETSGNSHLIEQLQNDTYPDGTPVFTSLTAFSFLIFTLVYFPCVAVIAAIRKESASWKWAVFTIFYTTGLAYLLSLIIYQTGQLF